MPPEHQVLLLDAIAAEGEGQAALMAGDRVAATGRLRAAAAGYRASWEVAPPRSYGRLIGMLKAAVLAGDGPAEAAYARTQLDPGADSPPAQYARAIVALIDGDDAAAGGRRRRDARRRSAAFVRTADAIAALADRDPRARTRRRSTRSWPTSRAATRT